MNVVHWGPYTSITTAPPLVLLHHFVSLSSRQESFPAKAVSLPDTEDQSMMGRFLRVERQVRGGLFILNAVLELRSVNRMISS